MCRHYKVIRYTNSLHHVMQYVHLHFIYKFALFTRYLKISLRYQSFFFSFSLGEAHTIFKEETFIQQQKIEFSGVTNPSASCCCNCHRNRNATLLLSLLCNEICHWRGFRGLHAKALILQGPEHP